MLPMLPEILLLMANWRPNMEKRRSQQRGTSTSAWPHQYAEGKSPETRSWARAPVWEGTRWPAVIWLVKCQIYLLIYHLLAFCAGSCPHKRKNISRCPSYSSVLMAIQLWTPICSISVNLPCNPASSPSQSEEENQGTATACKWGRKKQSNPRIVDYLSEKRRTKRL